MLRAFADHTPHGLVTPSTSRGYAGYMGAEANGNEEGTAEAEGATERHECSREPPRRALPSEMQNTEYADATKISAALTASPPAASEIGHERSERGLADTAAHATTPTSIVSVVHEAAQDATVSPSADLESRLRLLREWSGYRHLSGYYQGPRGILALALALLTLIPTLAPIKLHYLDLHLSLATAVYLAYHASNFVLFLEVRQAATPGAALMKTKKDFEGYAHYHRVVVKRLGYVVYALIALTIASKIYLQLTSSEGQLGHIMARSLGVARSDESTASKLNLDPSVAYVDPWAQSTRPPTCGNSYSIINNPPEDRDLWCEGLYKKSKGVVIECATESTDGRVKGTCLNGLPTGHWQAVSPSGTVIWKAEANLRQDEHELIIQDVKHGHERVRTAKRSLMCKASTEYVCANSTLLIKNECSRNQNNLSQPSTALSGFADSSDLPRGRWVREGALSQSVYIDTMGDSDRKVIETTIQQAIRDAKECGLSSLPLLPRQEGFVDPLGSSTPITTTVDNLIITRFSAPVCAIFENDLIEGCMFQSMSQCRDRLRSQPSNNVKCMPRTNPIYCFADERYTKRMVCSPRKTACDAAAAMMVSQRQNCRRYAAHPGSL